MRYLIIFKVFKPILSIALRTVRRPKGNGEIVSGISCSLLSYVSVRLVLHSITSHKEITHNEASNNDASHDKNIYKVTIFINDTIHRVVCHNSKHKGRCS